MEARALRLHGVRFNALYTITNMPISRFLELLIETGNHEGYMERLVAPSIRRPCAA